jgi:transposase-like protein
VKQDFIEFISKLSKQEKSELFILLKSSLNSLAPKDVTTCPCCGLTKYTKDGKYKGTQKYHCKVSNKYFTYRTNTVLSGIAKIEKFGELVNMLGNGVLPTLKVMIKSLKISNQTAFDWRTKILTALYSQASLDSQVVEFDEFFHYISRKGRRGMKYARKRGKRKVGDNNYTGKVFMAYSRSTGKVDFQFSHMGRTKADDVANYMGTYSDLHVYSDSHRSYISYFKRGNVAYDKFKAGDHVSKADSKVHNQTINAYAGQFHTLINQIHRGVSTKYIQGYCNWFSFVTNAIKNGTTPVEVITENKVAMQIYKQKEKEFCYLLDHSHRSNWGTCRVKFKMAA